MEATGAELKVGVLVDPGPIPRWQHSLLEGLARLPGCALTAWPEGPGATPGGSSSPRLLRRYESWDRTRFEEPGDALTLVDPPPFVGARGDALQFDLVLWLSDRPLPERAPEGISRGLWYLRHGDARVDRDAPLLAELRAGEGTVVTSLRALVGDRELVLSSSVGPSDPVSLHRSRARAYERAALLPLRVLSRRGSQAPPDEGAPPPRPEPPSTTTTLDVLARVAGRLLRRRLEARLFEPRWLIAYRRLEEPAAALPLAGSFETLLPPAGRAFADPFPLDDPSGDAILFEDIKAGLGTIAAVHLDEPAGVASPPHTVLSRSTHLSYPFLFRDDDELFMLPESRQDKRVELFRSTGSAREWRSEQVLLEDLPATDSTLFRHGGRIWLFATLSPDRKAAVDELHLFSASSLDGPWTPHPANPVVSDVRSARPAGALFRHGDQLLRPAQDCSRAYGWRVVLNRVETITEFAYSETPVGRIEPVGRAVKRVHTYNASARWETLDALWLAPRFRRRGGPRKLRFRLVRYPSWR